MQDREGRLLPHTVGDRSEDRRRQRSRASQQLFATTCIAGSERRLEQLPDYSPRKPVLELTSTRRQRKHTLLGRELTCGGQHSRLADSCRTLDV
jgi:hypothetical protein